MAAWDWLVIAVYLVAMVGLSAWLARGQRDEGDYYVGGRNLPWWAVGISVVATQSSAISFVSIPAFVALRPGGGLTWLQYELAVPLAMIFVLTVLVPYFRSLELVSVFEFLRTRFGPGTARFLSVIFLLSRGFGTGVGVYATALVVASMVGWGLAPTILLIGVAAVIYDTLGGIKAVVVSDVIQLALIVAGVVVAVRIAWSMAGGAGEMWAMLEPARRAAIDPRWGVGDEAIAPFWAYLIGGFFLYSSYYGTDQSQVQRVLCTRNTGEAKRALLLNGLARLPLTLLYVGLGVALGAVYQPSPELRAAVPADRLDALVPQFILLYVPVGLKGLILAAVLAAAMSSLDSAINSLSAVTMRDYVAPYWKLDTKRQLWWGKVSTVGWGALVTAAAFAAGGIDKTVIEAINKVGSAFYGPVLATFVLGVLTRRIGGRAMCAGVAAGVAVNVTFWLLALPVHWMWWNLIGFVVAVAVAAAMPAGTRSEMPPAPAWRETWRGGGGTLAALVTVFLVVLALVVGLG